MRIGLTGGLASGKSTVGWLLAAAGFAVIDADQLVAELYQPGGAGAEAAAEIFGSEILRPDGGVDRERLAGRVFADPGALDALERRIHPLVRQRFLALAAQTTGPIVLEATLLVEAGYAPDFDLVVSVEADPGLRLERAIARGLDEAQARARMAAQGDEATRRQAADLVIRNDGSLAELEQQVDRLVAAISGNEELARS
jgi:dephospho-CoA kinase